ncbi:hypothetical protein ACS0TY_024761 [Phlomoides rotata]
MEPSIWMNLNGRNLPIVKKVCYVGVKRKPEPGLHHMEINSHHASRGLVGYFLLTGGIQGCLSALDGTYIDVHIPTIDKGQYRNRMCQMSVNEYEER